MDLGQRVRHTIAGLRRAMTPREAVDPLTQPKAPARPQHVLQWQPWLVVLVVALVPIYYVSGAVLTHRINDDLNFKAQEPAPQGSKTIALMAGLIDREINHTAWAPNIQPFQPAALLRFGGNMANFQSGMIKALSNVTFEIESYIGRSRGTSAADLDLGRARQGLSRQPDTWLLDPWPTSSADQEYRKARTALLAYNARIASGNAVFDVRADNLQALLTRSALDLGSSSDLLEKQIDAGRKVWIDRRADKLFYFVKGQSYAYYMILSALRDDFKAVITERRVGAIYDAMLADLASSASMAPMIVQNGSPNGVLLPNHLSTEGFYLLRARAKLREITDILQR
ncbi:DUF2333 family protein [Candidatus Phycosocius spiralis]|uniref:DUF2333 family protein n=1 Tax=Candidatus Phycosocius spiralis TaxID=2815099 RepID=A0ABQ4PVA3_9PROT|nr:DUF2333 family protein [Candidatus Phycosocius spiralis]GIU66804.1 hypothetical protein PsB1_0958 [Candidatus Phycosocius spiralis]